MQISSLPSASDWSGPGSLHPSPSPYHDGGPAQRKSSDLPLSQLFTRNEERTQFAKSDTSGTSLSRAFFSAPLRLRGEQSIPRFASASMQ